MDRTAYFEICNSEREKWIKKLSRYIFPEMTNSQIVTLAFAYAKNNDLKNAKRVIKKIDFELDDVLEKTMFLETILLIDLLEKKPIKEVKKTAKKIIEYNPKAIMSRILLGGNAIIFEKDYSKGVNYFEQILIDYPEMDGVYYAISNNLLQAKKYKLSLQYIHNIKNRYIRRAYWLIASFSFLYLYVLLPILGFIIYGIQKGLLPEFIFNIYAIIFIIFSLITGFSKIKDPLINKYLAFYVFYPFLICIVLKIIYWFYTKIFILV